MNNLLAEFYHYICLKVFNAVEKIRQEKEKEKKEAVLSLMTFHGDPLCLCDGYSILGAQYMEFGEKCTFSVNAWVECIDTYGGQRFHPSLIVGNRFTMQRNGHIGCVEKIEIGDNVMLGSKVYITDHFHGTTSKECLNIAPADRPLYAKPIKIGNNVWIGDNVCIFPGVVLGNNVIVGANAVVTHSFHSNLVIAGCPAKVIKLIE